MMSLVQSNSLVADEPLRSLLIKHCDLGSSVMNSLAFYDKCVQYTRFQGGKKADVARTFKKEKLIR